MRSCLAIMRCCVQFPVLPKLNNTLCPKQQENKTKQNTQQALHSPTQYEPPLQPSSSELLTWVLSLKHCLCSASLSGVPATWSRQIFSYVKDPIATRVMSGTQTRCFSAASRWPPQKVHTERLRAHKSSSLGAQCACACVCSRVWALCMFVASEDKLRCWSWLDTLLRQGLLFSEGTWASGNSPVSTSYLTIGAPGLQTRVTTASVHTGSGDSHPAPHT